MADLKRLTDNQKRGEVNHKAVNDQIAVIQAHGHFRTSSKQRPLTVFFFFKPTAAINCLR